jgi:hypothetical protein
MPNFKNSLPTLKTEKSAMLRSNCFHVELHYFFLNTASHFAILAVHACWAMLSCSNSRNLQHKKWLSNIICKLVLLADFICSFGNHWLCSQKRIIHQYPHDNRRTLLASSDALTRFKKQQYAS